MPQAVAAAAVWVGNAIGTAIGATLTAVGVSASVALPIAAVGANVAMFVSELAITAGLNSVIDDVAHQKPAPMGQELNLRIAPDIAREMLVGIRATGGSMVARYSRGSNLYNAHFAIQLADHPCVELSKVYGDGRLVQSTPLSHGVRTEITAYSYSGGARVWMTWHDGRPGQAVDSDLVTKSAQDPDVVAGQIAAWSSTHRGAGCAWVHVEVQWDSDILTSIPEFLFLVKGAKFYDRRLDTTAGGSGSHRLNDPSTWAYTTNAAVVLDHYLLGYQVEDDELAFGVGLEPDEVPYATFAALADLADEDVTTGEGGAVEVIKRYAVNGIISAAQTYDDILESLQIQMAARIVDLGGRIGILGGEERASVVTLDDDDWADDESVSYADRLQFSDLYGGVVGSFADPGNLYQPTPYDRITTAYLALPDGGEATIAQVDLPLETHPRRAARLASAWISRESLQPRLAGTFATRSLAWKLEAGDWFTMSSDRLGFAASLFEVVDIVKHEDFTVTLTARAIDPDFLAFSTASDPDLSVPPAVDPYSLLLDPPVGAISAITITGGGATEPALRFTLTSAPAPTRDIVIEIMEWDGAALVGDPILTSMHSDEATKLVRAGIIPGKQYKARAKVRLGDRESAWTAWSTAVTASSTYTVPGSSLATAIVGQAPAATDFTIQPGATKNTLTFASSAPSSPTDGDIWVDTTSSPYIIKTRVSSAWQASASYGGIFGTTLYEAGGGAVASLANFKTILGTAAAITGQGWGATASQAAADNNYTLVPGANAARFSMLEGGGVIGWAVLNGGFGGAPAVSRKTSSPCTTAKPGLNFNNTSGSAGQVYYGAFGSHYALSPSMVLPVKSGDRVQVAARILELTGGCNGVLVRALQLDTAGAAVGELSPTAGLTVPVTVTAAGRIGCLATASQDGFVAIILYAQKASGTTSAGGCTADEMFISKARAGQVDIDLYTPGSSGEAGADVTSTHTAAAIINQGWGATASEAAARATRGRGLVKNSRFEEYFSGTAVPPQWASWDNGAGTQPAKAIGDGNCYRLAGGASANAGSVQTIAGVQAGAAYMLCCEARRVSGTLVGAGLHLQWLDSGGSHFAYEYLTIGTAADTGGLTSTTPDGVHRWEKLVTAPVGAVSAKLFVMSHWTGHGVTTSANSIDWQECDLIPMSLVAQLRADITASNTAAAITGQGGLATGSYYEQSSDPGSVANGSFWFKTTTNELYVRRSGAWGLVATIGASAISATASPTSISEIHTGSSFSSGTITITPAGGTSYTYAVTFVKSGGAANVTLSATNSATFTATGSLSSGQDVAGGIIVQVFDSGGKLPATIRIPLNFSRTD